MTSRANGFDAAELPDPLVPSDCVLTDFSYMPLHFDRLFRSMAWLERKDGRDGYEIFTLRLALWLNSWHEVPAASLANDERLLADRAECEPRRWRAVRDRVMKGFILCSDNRWYHPVVAEIALSSWDKKIKGDDRHAKDAEKMRRWRAAKAIKGGHDPSGGGEPRNPPRYGNGDGNANGNVTDHVDVTVTSIKRREEKKKESLSQTQYSECAREERAREVQPGGEPYPGSLPPDPIPEPAPKPPPSAPPMRGHMPCRSSPPQRWIALAGDDAITDDGRRGGQVAGYFLHQIAELVCQAARIEDADWRCDWRPLKAWLADGLDPQTIIAAVEWVARQADYEPPRSLMRFDGVVRRWRQERQA